MGAPKGSRADTLEKVVAKKLGLERTRGSGCVRGDGDAIPRYRDRIREDAVGILVDAKDTEKECKTLSVPFQELEKVAGDARRRGLIPVLVKQVGSRKPYVVLELEDFSYLYRVLNTKTE